MSEGFTAATLMTQITGLFDFFTVENLMSILSSVLLLCAPLALAWFGFRYAKRKASGAMKKGSL